ncbi:MAG TPA: hypothetical protein VF723_10685 [Pyrinomonadaceae bacterium]
MRRKSALLVLAALFLCGYCQSAIAQSDDAARARSMKGHELYSWRARGGWYFSLLVGTNRLKSYAEVTSRRVRIGGVAALKRELGKLPAGEEVFWSSGRLRGLSLPPPRIVEELRAYCERRGVRLVGAAEPRAGRSFCESISFFTGIVDVEQLKIDERYCLSHLL